MFKVEILVENAIDFFETAEEKTGQGKYTVAVVNHFKALISLVDFMIFDETGILPKDHEERFKILRYKHPEVLGLVSSSYGSYRKAYREKLSRYDAESLREEVLKIAEKCGLLERFVEK
jgi:HEPN domain-containing protein